MPTKPITCQRTPGGIRLLAVVSAACLLIPASGWGAGAKTLADKLRPDAEYGVSFDYQVQDNYQAQLKEYAEKGYAPAEAVPVRVRPATSPRRTRRPRRIRRTADRPSSGKRITTISNGRWKCRPPDCIACA